MTMRFLIWVILIVSVQAVATFHERRDNTNVIAGKYIVVYKADADQTLRKQHESSIHKKAKGRNKQGIHQVYSLSSAGTNGTDVSVGYAVEIDDADLTMITNSPLIAFVERDAVIYRDVKPASRPQPSNSGAKKEARDKTDAEIAEKFGVASRNPAVQSSENSRSFSSRKLDKRGTTVQKNAPWGLAKLSNCRGDDNGYLLPDPSFSYDSTAGGGVRVYVIDTGIYLGHSEFGGRAVWGANFVTGSPNKDEHGGGTHTAGVIAGKTYGIAKKAIPVAVKVFGSNGVGTTSQVMAGINWAALDAQAKGVASKSVMIISDQEPISQALNAFVKKTLNLYEITIITPAGDNGDSSLNYSPSSSTAFSVTAMTGDLSKPWWANHGYWVDISAPGELILSATIGGTSATALLSGTVPAAGFVAGLAAYVIAKTGVAKFNLVKFSIMDLYVAPYGFDPMGNVVPANVACLNP